MQSSFVKIAHFSAWLVALWKANMLKGRIFLLGRKVRK